MYLRVHRRSPPGQQLARRVTLGLISPHTADFLYHTAPLQYLPHILSSGALYSQSVLAVKGIEPRAGAARRDRMLGLADWVHLSLRPDTPLLRDKLRKGYPHILLVFRRDAVLALPEVALLPYNTKAWRSRAAYMPITDLAEKAALLQRQHETHQFPSLEVLVHYGLSLSALSRIVFVSDKEKAIVLKTLRALGISCLAPLETTLTLFPMPESYLPTTGDAIAAYFDECRLARRLLPPPNIPFD